jgi:hypothetical protein
MISGWLGYTKSINDKPHTEGGLGNARFVIDLTISFFMLYLLVLTSKNYFIYYFGDAFLKILPTIFFLYVLWDFIKSKEYPNFNPDLNRIARRRRFQTLVAFLSLTGVSFLYVFYDHLIIIFLWENQNYYHLFANLNTKYWIFMIISTFIIARYRLVKGDLFNGWLKHN